jgi:hypothetical protein
LSSRKSAFISHFERAFVAMVVRVAAPAVVVSALLLRGRRSIRQPPGQALFSAVKLWPFPVYTGTPPALYSAICFNCRRYQPSHVARVKASRLLLFCFIWSGACASALRFKRASAAEHHFLETGRSLFPVNRL